VEKLRTGFHGYGVAVKRLLLRGRRCFELRWPFGRPTLEYVETHLVDHCNMNCCGCSHFSPLAEPTFADLDVFARDMASLARLFRSIRTIRLMGGEPLLHPQVDQFLVCARNLFPRSRIHLVTNGVLLADEPESFWAACRENRVMLKLTVYPPMEARANTCVELCRKNGVRLVVTYTKRFCVWLNGKGDSPVNATFTLCRKTLYCPVLREGRLYACATAAYADFYNKRFGPMLPQDGGLALDKKDLTGREVLAWLNKPVALCRYCAIEKGEAPWRNGVAKAGDWFIATTEWPQRRG